MPVWRSMPGMTATKENNVQIDSILANICSQKASCVVSLGRKVWLKGGS